MKASLVPYRLRPQRLAGAPLADPAAVVRHLGAVQSQDHGMAVWSVGRRCGATLTDVLSAFERAAFVRTHVLRPTWHYVLREDLRDLLEVTAPRVMRPLQAGMRTLGFEEGVMERGAELTAEVVAAEGPLTRAEVGERLAAEGLPSEGSALAHVVMAAEIAGDVVSGPMRGKQHTYVTADLPASGRTPDERLAWIARTYARGHGPVQARDLAWWTSITLTQARRALELAELRPVEINGETYVAYDDLEPVEVPRAMLLANFDELISYVRDREDHAHLEDDYTVVMRSGGLLLVDGRLCGSWSRSMTASTVAVTVRPVGPIDRATEREIESEAEAFGRFCERSVDLEVVRQPD